MGSNPTLSASTPVPLRVSPALSTPDLALPENLPADGLFPKSLDDDKKLEEFVNTAYKAKLEEQHKLLRDKKD